MSIISVLISILSENVHCQVNKRKEMTLTFNKVHCLI